MKIKQICLLPISEFNKSISLVFITDLLIAICLMGYNLYIPVYLQDHLKIISNTKWISDISTFCCMVSFKLQLS